MTGLEDRQALARDIQEARKNGARLRQACAVVGIRVRTLQRWQTPDGDIRPDGRPDALLVAMWGLTAVAPVAARLSGHQTKILVSEHGMLSAQYSAASAIRWLLMRASLALAYRLADRRVAVSRGVADDMAALSGMHRNAFDVIYNPVPPRPQPTAEEMQRAEELWSVPRGARILTVGTMQPAKNHSLLLQAFARLMRNDARLMIVGDGKERASVEALAHELGVNDRLILPGFQRNPTPYYCTADLFVLSSVHEGFSNVIVEALSCGTPVVSTDCPSGPAEILEHGRYGILTPVGDVDALAHAIDRALETPVDPEMLKRRAADFSPSIATRAYLNLLGLK